MLFRDWESPNLVGFTQIHPQSSILQHSQTPANVCRTQVPNFQLLLLKGSA